MNGCDQVRPEPDRIVVALIKRKPRYGLITLRKPTCYQGSFAEARRSRDQGQFSVWHFIQAIIKVWPRDEVDTKLGNIELGGKKLFQF